MKVRIFTDGACSGNPGIGGWGALIALTESQQRLSGGCTQTTNNQMELTAVVASLRYVIERWDDINVWEEYKGVEIVSDSAYVVNAVNQRWIQTWKNNRWKTTTNEHVKNKALWVELDELLKQAKCQSIEVTFVKVKGHAGHYFNELVDQLARDEVNKIKSGEKVL